MAEEQADPVALEERIAYAFKDKAILQRALTHPSFGQGQPQTSNNQRLEFLGDAILGLVLAEALFAELPDEREGTLTQYRSMLVKGHQLSILAREIGLGQYLRLGEAEDDQGGRHRSSILEDALEAVVGAVYQDGGLDAARSVVMGIYGSLASRLEFQTEAHNPKGRLQELLQPQLGSQSIEYRLIAESGPDHRKHFTVEAWIQGECKGQGSGNSKKLAEEAAAMEALEALEDCE